MEKILSAEEFIERVDHKKVSILLNLFSLCVRAELPKEVMLLAESFVMLDLIKVAATEVVLPVVIRSSAWLADVNCLKGQALDICLHEEFWPVLQRFGLVGGFCEIHERDPVAPLRCFLEKSIKYWQENKLECAISLSDRANIVLGKVPFPQVRIIRLSDRYKAMEIPFQF